MQLAPHGRLTRGGFSGSDGLLLPPVVNERRVRERVGQRRAVFDRDGVAVSLNHLERHGEYRESHGISGRCRRVQVSDTTYALVKDDFVCEERGEIEIRGRGLLTTYFVLAGR
jgi:adenylate/guanylate cyclase family protein